MLIRIISPPYKILKEVCIWLWWPQMFIFFFIWDPCHMQYAIFWNIKPQTDMIFFLKWLLKFGMKNDYFKNQANVFSFNFYLIMISIEYEVKYNCNFQQIKFHKKNEAQHIFPMKQTFPKTIPKDVRPLPK